jgi:uncharacterized protein
MDGVTLAWFLAAAFFGGLTSGLSGFAMGLVVSGVWLQFIAPDQNALLIALCGLVIQGAGIWRVRHAIAWRTILPFVLGGAVGVAAGSALLATVDQNRVRLGIGILLLLYSAYSLARPALHAPQGGAVTHLGVGVVNGLIGGLTGLGGIVVTIWGQLRGGSKDAQRAVFQPVIFATFLMSAISFAFLGTYTAETMKLYAFALPAVIAGVGCGIWLYGKLDDAAFRRLILILLFASGMSLVGSVLVRSA